MSSLPQPVRNADASGAPIATLEDVDIRAELLTRPRRPPDYESEDRAFHNFRFTIDRKSIAKSNDLRWRKSG